MAIFKGTTVEFMRYVGPRLRNVVQLITKKQKSTIGACEHCGCIEKLESAHLLGRDRTEIIDLLLGTVEPVEVDLGQFEKDFKAEHEPVEKAILILCRDCHMKYDSKKTRRQMPTQEMHLMSSSVPRSIAQDILPITLDPPNVDTFKYRLLECKVADLKIFYNDGRTEIRTWKVSNFKKTSNVFGNLRSRKEFRQGKWQSQGIVKLHVRVVCDS